MTIAFDVAVAGLGVHGAAIARALARRGVRVLGIDARRPPHVDGSSHGRTRILRAAYFEHPLYVPLVQHALHGWRRLEQESEQKLFRTTGALNVGPADGALIRGTEASVRMHGLAYERLDAAAIRRRFRALRPDDDAAAIYEPDAGALATEACVAALIAGAAAAGATIRLDEPMLEWQAAGGGVTVRTSRGFQHAGVLVLALGAWLPEQLGGAHVPLAIERQTQHWFEAGPELSAGECPILLWEYARDRVFWAIPDLGDGLKAGIHHEGECSASAAAVTRTVTAADAGRVRAVLERYVPTLGRERSSSVCLYTNTPDHDFVIDRHAGHAQVLIASACSGHGFKFAPALAEHVADLALGGEPAAALAPFRVGRFSEAGTH
jgi:sarcosine oxidase